MNVECLAAEFLTEGFFTGDRRKLHRLSRVPGRGVSRSESKSNVKKSLVVGATDNKYFSSRSTIEVVLS